MDQVLIIAEAGVNHNGSIDKAKKLIDVASNAGADFIKFQTFKTELNISREVSKAEYQKINTKDDQESQYEMVKKIELEFDSFRELEKYCSSKNIGFLSTAFDIPSIEFLDTIKMPFLKIPSGEITNYPLLKAFAKKNKPLILSTGMSTLGEIENALEVLLQFGRRREDITILHCNTEYPTPMKDVNLKAMKTIAQEFNVRVGYSDHTLGIEVPVAAVAMGAKIIEKHFTLDRNLPGPDHKASLEPDELKEMVKAIRNVETAIGSGIKKPSISELKNVSIVRRSIHTAKSISKGTTISYDDLIMLRPGDGISPMKINKVVGKTATRDLTKEYKIDWKDFK